MRSRFPLLLVVNCLALVSLATTSSNAATIDEFNRRVEGELQASAPGAVPLWREANEARDGERPADAIRLYGEVLQLAPRFDHALRRRAGVRAGEGDRAAALTDARAALSISDSPENLATLALILVQSAGEPVAADVAEAKPLAARAARLAPSDAFAQQVAAQVAIAAGDLDMLRPAVRRLEVLEVQSPQTHVLRSMVAASDGEWSEVREALDRAAAAGLSKDVYQGLLDEYESARPFYVRWWKPVAVTVGVWFGVFALLLAAAALLSRAALRAARAKPDVLDGTVTGLSARVRRAYASVLSLCCVFYYASIPIIMLLVIAVAGSLLYATFAIGHIPIKLVILIVVVAGVTLWSMVKSLFIRVSDEEPGLRLDLAKEAKLRALLDDVAMQIGTRAVDNVYLTPGTEVAVMERGKGKTRERCLILGVAALDGFLLRPFKAVLGHEYGHFTNRDTAGGAFALSVRRSLGATAVALAEGGAAAWYNPAWLFVNGFHSVFMRISQGASRLQEVLADRWATFAYGAEAFERGLRHVVTRSVHFDAHVGVTIKEVVDGQVPLANLYTYVPAATGEDLTADIAPDIDEAMNRKSSAYDSHPAPNERFALVHALPQSRRPVELDDEAHVWSIFSNPEELQHAMTAQVRENVRANYGVEILEPAVG